MFWNRACKLPPFDSNRIQNGISKLKQKIIAYLDHESFHNAEVRSDVVAANFDVYIFGTYKNTIFNIFNGHDPMKKKYIHANEAAFMS